MCSLVFIQAKVIFQQNRNKTPFAFALPVLCGNAFSTLEAQAALDERWAQPESQDAVQRRDSESSSDEIDRAY